MRELKFITACPDDKYYTWQVHLWIESLKSIGHSDKAIVVLFIPKNRPKNPDWEKIITLYPEAEFHFYEGDNYITALLGTYIPILRPYVMSKYLTEHPERVNDALFYCDSDILFTENFNIDAFLDDEICYLSDTNSYINASYFDSKINQVLPDKIDEYKARDILQELTSLIGISREVVELNNLHSGGAQYLLKNMDTSFWNKVQTDCIIIKKYLQNVNKEFFKDESSGFQSWCADMWAVLWNLWLRNQETRVVSELNFSWATDRIEKLQTNTIFHNAGITGTSMNGYPCFYKGKYHLGTDPTEDSHIQFILNHEESKKYCTWYYTNKLQELKNKYNLQY